MRALIIALVFAIVAIADARDLVAEFEAFKAEHKRSYATLKEELARFQIFTENMKRAEELQKLNPLATFGVTKFADMTPEEFEKHYHNGEKYFERAAAQNPNPPRMFTQDQVIAAGGQAIDWRTKNAVTEVKDQAHCGSCWAFAATGNIEGQWAVAGNPLVSVSEQELVSCDHIDDGCDGGLMDNAYKWLLQTHNGSIVTEASYPYVSGNGNVPKCNMDKTVVGATITGFKDLPHDEGQMAAFVYSSGPLGIGVDATSFQTYRGGILTNCISRHMNHGVLIVGFDDNNDPPYWIIKNSWSKGWGEQGYIRLKKGSNQCLLTGLPSTPLVGSGPTPTTSPTPTTPAPGQYFEQKHCTDPKCTQCTVVQLPQGKCITAPMNSYTARCITDGLLVQTYATRDCQGPYTETVNPTDVCMIIYEINQTEEFLMNNCHPGPTTAPTPTTGPTPPPASTFTQLQCTDAQCSQNCENETFPVGKCLSLVDGGSAIAQCTPTQLVLTEYKSEDCTGASTQNAMPLNKCLLDPDGSIENFCNGGPGPNPTTTNPTPPPTNPPTTPPPSGSLIQEHCYDSACTQGCRNNTFPLNTCLPLSGGGSAKAFCKPPNVELDIYRSSTTCTGSMTPDLMPLGKCLRSSAGDYFENFCTGGPTPPPTTPAPTTPAPTTPAPGKSFTQMQCTDTKCSRGCENDTFPLGECLQLEGGGSAIASCNPPLLTLQVFPSSTNCKGSSIPESMPLNKCLRDEEGGSFENFCNSGAALIAARTMARKMRHN